MSNKAMNCNYKAKNGIEKSKLINDYILLLDEKQKMKFWIKTLLSSYNAIPEILKTIDKIIEIRASSLSFASDIYNMNGTTIDQVERVIDLSERKNSLLNIYLITQELAGSVHEKDQEFLEKRFVHNWTIEELANEYDISIRTVYRRIEKLIEDTYETSKRKNWSLKFIEMQIKNEHWLKQKFIKQVTEYFKNTNYKFNSAVTEGHHQHHNLETLGNVYHSHDEDSACEQMSHF